MLFFSIIVVSYNAANSIRQTINSILSQDFDDYEIIVKDAVSKDNTLEMIPQDDRIRVYSTKDNGIYDGMNQAISYARGRYVCFMNCGDSFYNNQVLSSVYKICSDRTENTIAYGDYFSAGHVFCQPEQITKKFLFRRPLCHQSMFFSSDLFSRLGTFDTTFKIVADYDLTLKSYCAKVDFIHSGVVVCNYEGGGFSARKDTRKILKKENKIVYKRYFTGAEIFKNNVKAILTLRPLRTFIISDKAPKFLNRLYVKMSNKINK